MTKREIAINLLSSFATGDVAFLKKVVSPTYIQHNLHYKMGAETLIGAVERLSKAPIKPTVKIFRSIEDKDHVVLHSQCNLGFGDIVAIDVLRFENGKVAEHWGNMLPVQKPNPSGHTQTDGTVVIKDLAKTEENKKVVRAFQEELAKNNFPGAVPYLDPHYVQHNPSSGDGLAGVQAAIAEAAKKGLNLKFGKIHQVFGEGDLVYIGSEGMIGTTPIAIFDLFRVSNKKLVEHWDVIEPVLNEKSPQWVGNTNGKW